MRCVIAVVLLPLGFGACADATPGALASEYSVTDSAGVVVIRSGGVGTLEPAVLDSPQVTLRIGAVEGATELQFFRISAVAESERGEIYVVDAGHAEVRVFDSAGRFVRKFGRRGQGPGEFQFPASAFTYGDTVAIVDAQLRRVAIFDTTGQVLSTEPLLRGTSANAFMNLAGRGPDGWFVHAYTRSAFDYQHGVARVDTFQMAHVRSVVAGLNRLGEPNVAEAIRSAAPEWQPIVAIPGRRSFGNQTPIFMSSVSPLFEPRPTYAIDARGYVHYTSAADYVIDTYDTRGEHTRRLIRSYSPVPVTEDLASRFAARARSHWDTVQMTGEMPAGKSNDEARAGLPHVSTLPPIGRMYASPNGSLWVERIDLVPDPLELEWTRSVPPPRPTKWDLFDPDGRLLGIVTLPAGFAPRSAGDRSILGVWRDEFDVQYVVRYSLRGGS